MTSNLHWVFIFPVLPHFITGWVSLLSWVLWVVYNLTQWRSLDCIIISIKLSPIHLHAAHYDLHMKKIKLAENSVMPSPRWVFDPWRWVSTKVYECSLWAKTRRTLIFLWINHSNIVVFYYGNHSKFIMMIRIVFGGKFWNSFSSTGFEPRSQFSDKSICERVRQVSGSLFPFSQILLYFSKA